MAYCPNSNEYLRMECPVRGTGTLSEAFLVELGTFLDNDAQYPGNWRGLAWNLLQSTAREMDNFLGRANRDNTGRRSPTWEVYQKFIHMYGEEIDITAWWKIFYHNMKRRDVALELERWHQSNRLFEQQQFRSYHQPSMVDLPNSLSVATTAPEEASDINSTVPDVNLNTEAREVDTVQVTAKTVIITTVPGQQIITHTPPSTETTSLTSTSSSSTSSLPQGDPEFADPPRESVIPTGTSPGVRSRSLPDSTHCLGTVLISYADHDKPKAVDIALHLRFNGYNPVLDNTEEIPERERKRKCKKVFKKACAVVVIYSNFYRTEIFDSGKIRNTRYIYNLLKEEHESKSSNQRCVLYPMYQIQKGSKLPRIFNHLPRQDGARQVHGCLFRPAR
ncbi:hypothetical protein HOLleu_35854 [Holothuria leucospilota]|uniref:TIR domain-containing protein n=1 Tax=Holothuria leucospilota TaxID=206669 RepID=A0A9Q0YNF4_HOLLE|nr:hypothetical protein HOLleu_35854 [Holothuria leucospilota]